MCVRVYLRRIYKRTALNGDKKHPHLYLLSYNECIQGRGEATWITILQSRNRKVEVDRFRVHGVFSEKRLENENRIPAATGIASTA